MRPAMALRELSEAELKLKIEDLRKGLFNLRVRATTKELQNVSQIKAGRRELARTMTVLRQKQLTEKKA